MNKIQKEALSTVNSICKYRDVFSYVHRQIIISSIIIGFLFITSLWFDLIHVLGFVIACMGIEILILFTIILIISGKYTDFINKTSKLTDKEYIEVIEEAQANNKWDKMLDKDFI